MLDMPSIKDTEKMWVIYEDGQTFGESLPLWTFEDGVWVSDTELDRFERLVGIPIEDEAQ